MSLATLHNTIRTQFGSLVEDTQSVSVVYDNAPDEHPDDALWVRCWIQDGVGSQVDSGPTFRSVGRMVATIYQPIEQGDKAGLELADVIVDAFRRITYSGVKFLVPTVQQPGVEGKWWRINVICPFRCDQTT